jgi:hypothetical protein
MSKQWHHHHAIVQAWQLGTISFSPHTSSPSPISSFITSFSFYPVVSIINIQVRLSPFVHTLIEAFLNSLSMSPFEFPPNNSSILFTATKVNFSIRSLHIHVQKPCNSWRRLSYPLTPTSSHRSLRLSLTHTKVPPPQGLCTFCNLYNAASFLFQSYSSFKSQLAITFWGKLPQLLRVGQIPRHVPP